jgi:penicillin-binding protein 2
LSQSCDVYFYQVGEALGVDRLAKYANALGLGYPTGISLDRESRGLIPTAEWKLRRFGVPWQKGETLSIAIGQGFNLVTPLQMAVLAATIGNGGTRYKPYMVQEIRSIDDQITFSATPEVVATLKLKPTTIPLVHQALWEVVNDARGTAYLSRFKELQFAGKTGTAQVVGRPGDGDGTDQASLPKDHAWFVCYAPSENPKIAAAVIIEHGEHGSSAAAPVAREMVRVYLKMPPDSVTEKIEKEKKERLEKQDIVVVETTEKEEE